MDLETIVEQVRQITQEVVAHDAVTVDREARWPERGLRALQDAGMGGLVIPEKLGGLGIGLLGLTRVCEQIGTHCASTGLCFGMHCVGSAVIAAKATEDQMRYLDNINRGQHLTTLALSEPGTGVHFYFPQTRLIKRSDGDYVVDGKKHFVTNGGYADSYVVSTVAADPNAPPGDFSCVVIPRDAEGMVWGGPWQGLGMRGNQSRVLELQQVSVARRDLLGADGDQIWYVFNVIAPYFLIAMAGTYLGLASAAFDETRRHMEKRQYAHSGSSLGQVPILQHRLGKLWSDLQRTRQLVYWAASEADAGGPEALPGLCSAKADVADCVVTIVNEAMTLCGGIAYREHSKFDRMLRDARAAHVMTPTTDILRTWTGRGLLGQPLLGD
jgi:alkylation response protein AidB-like acyl-CoA dehydrogenase